MTMDMRLKERLVGAAVLVMAAVLFIPMVLDGPNPDRHVSRNVALPDATAERRTVRIDLADRGAATRTAAPELDAVVEDEPAAIDLTSQQEAEAAATEPSPPVTVEPKPDKPVAKGGADTNPPSEAENAPWTVQAGSFSQDDNAEGLAEKLRKLGYPAYVSRFNDGKRIHYRVRVGGFPSRDAAQERADEIRRKTGGPANPVPAD